MDLLEPILEGRELSRILSDLAAAESGPTPRARVGGLWGSGCAYFAAGLARALEKGVGPDLPPDQLPSGILVVTPSPETADEFAADFRLFSELRPMAFPAWDALPEEPELINHEVFGDRLGVLEALLFERDEPDQARPETVITSVQALLQPVVPPDTLLASTLEFRTGDELEPRALAELLVDQGFEREDVAEIPGTFAARGGIVDVYPFGTFRPLRIEFFGDEIESVREYDPGTQRSLKLVDTARILAIGGEAYPHVVVMGDVPTFLVYVPRDWLVLLAEPVEIQERAERLAAAERDKGRLFDYEKVARAWSEHPIIETSVLRLPRHAAGVNFDTAPTERFTGRVDRLPDELAGYVETSDRVFVFCNNAAEEQRLRELLAGTALEDAPELGYAIGHLWHGFQFGTGRTTFIAHHDIFHRYHQHRALRPRARSEPIESFAELGKGDYVVHVSHGIARYRGLVRLEKAGEMREFLDLEFADAVRLYVPVTKIDLVQKYLGSAAAPSLSKLGGERWEKRKQAARDAVRQLALDLLEVQAAREKAPGVRFPPDDHMMREFEEAFIYPETADQTYAAGEIKRDMHSAQPMDRLLCGDVGYGKTELAMRAAFKAVEGGKQVAMLVPTTVLSQQHYGTFTERMADYPVFVDFISRFKTPGEQKETLAALAEGRLDILIGTHRLLSRDVAFNDLGLVIIDEEQRFGVVHKERLKRLRYTVDVLTMTATPIPRTLHMSMLGLRDISSLTTPPQDRMAIHTEVRRFDDDLIRDAILRELNRDGQVFFVHNRVHDIDHVAHRLAGLVPEARLIIAHGQMKERQLARRMSAFVAGDGDVLVCTSIIESGLDIPSANTIIIHEADRFGLADLHQLRGRVGRYKHRAYAYLLLPESRPITRQALKRLKAIEEYSELGSGFKLAMRDLEIRGAGNILGAEQSGHIAAVGYELYCRLLEQAVRELKHESIEERTEIDMDLQLDAYIPSEYIRSDVLKMEAYRRLARARSVDELRDTETELEDRFGRPPDLVVNLIAKHRLRVRLQPRKLTYLGLRGDHLLLKFEDGELVEPLSTAGADVRVLSSTSAHLVLPPNNRTPERVVDYLEHLLEGVPD
ncbi:MAG: transcription-repair coupling factor [Planctomycetota bacterium]